MKKLIIEGCKELSGSVRISGAKNSVVALIPATMLTKGKCVIENVPDISDVRILIEMMKYLGSEVTFENEVLTIDNKNVKNKMMPEEYASKIEKLKLSAEISEKLLKEASRLRKRYPLLSRLLHSDPPMLFPDWYILHQGWLHSSFYLPYL